MPGYFGEGTVTSIRDARKSALRQVPECLGKLRALESLDLRFTNAMSGGDLNEGAVAWLRKKLPGCEIQV